METHLNHKVIKPQPQGKEYKMETVNETVVNTGNLENVENAVVETESNNTADTTGEKVQEKPKVKVTGIPETNEGKIALFKEIVGEIPKGMEIIMHGGKPQIYGKINGRPVTKSLDSIIREYSLSEAAEEKLQQAKIEEKRVKEQSRVIQEAFSRIMENPEYYIDVLRNAGVPDEKIYEMSYKQLERALEESNTPQEVKDARKIKNENEYIKKQIAEREEREKVEKERQEKVVEYQKTVQELSKALEDNKIFDKDIPENLRLQYAYNALHWLKVAEDQGIKDFTPDKAVKRAVRDLESWGKTYYGSLSDDILVKMLPDKVAKVYAKSLEKATVTPTVNSLINRDKVETEVRPKGTINEFFNKI